MSVTSYYLQKKIQYKIDEIIFIQNLLSKAFLHNDIRPFLSIENIIFISKISLTSEECSEGKPEEKNMKPSTKYYFIPHLNISSVFNLTFEMRVKLL